MNIVHATVVLVGLTVTGNVDSPKAFTKPGKQFTGTITKVVDGDTVQVTVHAWVNTPWDPVYLRISGIDTPEVSIFDGAKCPQEIALGFAAQTYARTLVHIGDKVKFKYWGVDKYGSRIDASVTLPDGRDWGTIMLTQGYAKPYNGGTKPKWCPSPPPTPSVGAHNKSESKNRFLRRPHPQ